jgi:CP family cyanate transporter-like MFS transporter
MRVTILAVPPVLPAIGRDLHLTQGTIGALTSLSTFLFFAAAVPGALLIARIGPRRALLIGVLVLGVFAALRGVGPSTGVLFGTTLIMAAGVAICQPAIPTLIRDWHPARVGLAIAVFSNGQVTGEAVPPALIGPVLLPALHQSWELSLALWSLPVALLFVLLLATTRELPVVADLAAAVPRRLPDFRNPQLWLIGLAFGLDSAAYWGANAFIPGYVHATGRAELKDAALTALNAAQVVASIVVLLAARHMVARRWPFLLMGGGIAAGYAGMLLSPGWGIVLFAGIVGFITAMGMIVTMALPPLLAAPEDVHTFSAGIFAICYATAFVTPSVGGAVWDATHVPMAPFLLFGAGGVVAFCLALVTRYGHVRR